MLTWIKSKFARPAPIPVVVCGQRVALRRVSRLDRLDFLVWYRHRLVAEREAAGVGVFRAALEAMAVGWADTLEARQTLDGCLYLTWLVIRHGSELTHDAIRKGMTDAEFLTIIHAHEALRNI